MTLFLFKKKKKPQRKKKNLDGEAMLSALGAEDTSSSHPFLLEKEKLGVPKENNPLPAGKALMEMAKH